MAATFVREGLNLVLVGFVGGGKTSTANTILGRKEFIVAPTSKVSSAQGHRTGTDFNVVDTPGLQSTKDIELLHQNITTRDGINICFLVVIKLKRFTDEESFSLSEMLRRNPSMLGRTVVIFTNLREIENKDSVPDRAIERFVNRNHTLLSFLKKYGLSYFGIENKFASENDKNKRVKLIIEAAKKDAKMLEDKDRSKRKTPQREQEISEHAQKVATSKNSDESIQGKSVTQSLENFEEIKGYNCEMTLDDHVARIVQQRLETVLPIIKEELKEELREQLWNQLREETVPVIREEIKSELLEKYDYHLVNKTKNGK